MSDSPWWVSPLTGLLGVIVGSAVPLLAARRLRLLERRGEVLAMTSEIYQSRLRARTLIRENIQAPLYRLPTTIFNLKLPNLIGDGELSAPEIDILVEYVNRADELNRGMERAGAAHLANPNNVNAIKDEYNRNVAKAREIVEKADPQHFGGLPILEAADKCLDRMDKLYSRKLMRGGLLKTKRLLELSGASAAILAGLLWCGSAWFGRHDEPVIDASYAYNDPRELARKADVQRSGKLNMYAAIAAAVAAFAQGASLFIPKR